MKRKLILYLVIVAILVVGAYAIVGSLSAKAESEYLFSTISRGNLESIISATGTLSPVTTVDIGTQVSGTIDSVYVDFNDYVKRDQVLAVLDTTLLKTSVLEAEASRERVEAALQEATSTYDRNKKLYDGHMISEADYLTSEVAYKTQKASLKSADVALVRARRNLEYAVIKSPINGIVISKNVESGQTVAASLSTPTLFIIAEDLSHMEILAEVDESDIGQIKEGQQVRFEVQTYSDKEFTGTVKQVRLEPTTISNVVTYTVVVEVANDEGILLPGMTATVDFIIEQKNDILLVPNKALRFTPSEDQIQAFAERRRSERENMPDSLKTGRPGMGGGPGMMAGGPPNGAPRQRPADMKQVWYLNEKGQLTMAPVRVGMSDGVNTEIVMSRSLKEGNEIITGSLVAGASKSQSSRRPGFGPPRF